MKITPSPALRREIAARRREMRRIGSSAAELAIGSLGELERDPLRPGLAAQVRVNIEMARADAA